MEFNEMVKIEGANDNCCRYSIMVCSDTCVNFYYTDWVNLSEEHQKIDSDLIREYTNKEELNLFHLMDELSAMHKCRVAFVIVRDITQEFSDISFTIYNKKD